MICENCKRLDASLIFLVDSFTEKKIDEQLERRKIKWTKYLCSECYIFLTWGSEEYDNFKKSQRKKYPCQK